MHVDVDTPFFIWFSSLVRMTSLDQNNYFNLWSSFFYFSLCSIGIVTKHNLHRRGHWLAAAGAQGGQCREVFFFLPFLFLLFKMVKM